MRLIDADALEKRTSEETVFSGRPNNPELIGANKIMSIIDSMPEIKAIPVDWISHWLDSFEINSQMWNMYLSVVNQMLEEWGQE